MRGLLYLAAVTALAVIVVWPDELKSVLGSIMAPANWGIVGSLLMAIPPAHDLILRFRRTSAERQSTGSLAFLATAVAKGWERERNALSIFDIMSVGLGALCLAISFYLT